MDGGDEDNDKKFRLQVVVGGSKSELQEQLDKYQKEKEKLEYLQKRYVEYQEEAARLQRNLTESQQALQQLSSSADAAQGARGKGINPEIGTGEFIVRKDAKKINFEKSIETIPDSILEYKTKAEELRPVINNRVEWMKLLDREIEFLKKNPLADIDNWKPVGEWERQSQHEQDDDNDRAVGASSNVHGDGTVDPSHSPEDSNN
ncbi:hypothetical protein M441DRAFT_90618 [Trichoderma asperellum CBS 433.97]|uniref:Uncharacterized protein n=1 Tax=Trichoderma asperellum (strain ATCC 204424 / CBS 433.97 / NBRC 101777) TaxID=1042311 RepID=A0A2T3Z6A6_TRIA4|nr:hypothetical protein M441DRAFT_90618 [Trichoderma asperellum CBS 433.97]PTB40356.1 hypothetical protein M441DRAFT_90618 [Trichoderma asperellum CBS 433.97]WVH32723.1 myosin-like coiled-coil protein [Trichoderma asperellum]